jgi:hypothetical protein
VVVRLGGRRDHRARHGKALKEAYEEVEEEEDEHLYHTAGWSGELWIQGLGMPALGMGVSRHRQVKRATLSVR